MFIWDAGNINHIAKHAILPEEAEQVLENNPIDLGDQLRNGERRYLHLGETAEGRILTVITARSEDDIRVVTAHPSDRKARRFYLSHRKAAKHV